MARRKSAGRRRARTYRKIRRSVKPKMFKSLAVDAMLLEGGALIIGGASATQINGIKNAIEGASKNIPLLGTIIASVGVTGTLLALKVFGGTWWANKVKSILPGWRP